MKTTKFLFTVEVHTSVPKTKALTRLRVIRKVMKALDVTRVIIAHTSGELDGGEEYRPERIS